MSPEPMAKSATPPTPRTYGGANAVVARRSRPSKRGCGTLLGPGADGYRRPIELATCGHDRRHALIVTARAPKYLGLVASPLNPLPCRVALPAYPPAA
jgi:hypothetical protein